VAALVTNAMPPYLIGQEARSFVPFSATNESSTYGTCTTGQMAFGTNGYQYAWEGSGASNEELLAQDGAATINAEGQITILSTQPVQNLSQIMSDEEYMSVMATGHQKGKISTCWEILTLRLGLFVKEQLAQGIQITNEALQRQARIIIYDSDDAWNQTSADNTEWLELFKKAHGLPSLSKDQHVDLNEDLGVNLSNFSNIGDMSFDIAFPDNAFDAPGSNLDFNLNSLTMF